MDYMIVYLTENRFLQQVDLEFIILLPFSLILGHQNKSPPRLKYSEGGIFPKKYFHEGERGVGENYWGTVLHGIN